MTRCLEEGDTLEVVSLDDPNNLLTPRVVYLTAKIPMRGTISLEIGEIVTVVETSGFGQFTASAILTTQDGRKFEVNNYLPSIRGYLRKLSPLELLAMEAED